MSHRRTIRRARAARSASPVSFEPLETRRLLSAALTNTDPLAPLTPR